MLCDIKDIQNYVSLIKDVITILAASTGAVIAICGYHTWKKQIKWKTKYELAQKYLKAVYKIRDALATVRSPFQSGEETADAMRQEGLDSLPHNDQSYRAKSMRAVYNRRFQKVNEALSEFDSILLEAETLWGEDVRSHKTLLLEHPRKLFVEIGTHISNTEHEVPYDVEKENKRMAIMYKLWGDSVNDLFANEVNDTVKIIEEFLRDKIKGL